MKLENIIYQIRKILKTVGLDSRVEDRMLIDFINRYRAFNIKKYYDANRYLKQEWFSNLGILSTTIVNSSDDPNVQYTSVIFGKYQFPKCIDIPNERTRMIRAASKQQRIEEKDIDIIYKMIETDDELLRDYTTYHFIGDIAYFYPHISKIWGSGILSDPRDAITYDELKDYYGTVISAQGTKRNLTVTDEYPICDEIATIVVLDILTKEFNLERNQIPNITVDGADSDDLVKSPV